MERVIKTVKPFYQYQEISPNVYQQIAQKDGRVVVNDHLKLVTKGEQGGLLRLSSKDVVRDKQKHDIALSNAGNLVQNTWLSKDSSLTGDFKLPLNSLILHSHVKADNQHAVLINDVFFNNTRAKIEPDTNVSITNSELTNSEIRTKPSKDEQVLFINNSVLNKTSLTPVDSSQMIVDSTLDNVKVRGNSDIDASNFKMTTQPAFLHNTSAHGTDVMLQKGVLIISDSDIQEQSFTDKQAINGYLVIKNDCIRGEKPSSTKTSKKTDDLEMG